MRRGIFVSAGHSQSNRSVMLRGNHYPVSVHGTGKTPCFSIGIGSLMQRTMSEKFRKDFTIYSSDLYWINKQKLDPAAAKKLTMDDFAEDVIKTIDQLKLHKPILLAHSCYGILALEVAKKANHNIGGIIMVASPPAWSPETIAFARSHFDKYASADRKENDKLRQAEYAKVKKPDDSCINLNVYEADSARYWANYNISHEDLASLWKDIEVDDVIGLHFFDTVLPAHDIKKDMDKISVPVFLAVGTHDYDSVPLELWKKYPKPNDFTLLDCGEESGHWPNIESQEKFDMAVSKWLDEKILSKNAESSLKLHS